jgi:2-methylisocitrate lyase-like PEP mutase family enzyme
MYDRGRDSQPRPSTLRFWLGCRRIAAAAQAAHALPFPFVITARAHNLLHAPASLEDTITRLQAFERAGADVLFAPGLPDLAAVRAVCAAVSKPVNFMVGIKGKSFSVSELAAAGVRRISLARSLYRAAMTGFLDAANESKRPGTVQFSRPVRDNAGTQQTHGNLTAVARQNVIAGEEP